MTTPSVTITAAPNAVPPGDTIRQVVTTVTGTGGGLSINVGDTIQLALTLPTGVTAVDARSLSYIVPNPVQTRAVPLTKNRPTSSMNPFTLTLAVGATVAAGTYSIGWTWQNTTQGEAPQAGTNFNLVVGFTNEASLVYTLLTVPPCTQAQLSTAVTAAVLHNAEIQTKAGVFLDSDTVSNVTGGVARTVNYLLAYGISGQFNGNNALPANTTTRQFLAVTTSGANANVGTLIYDNGTGVGTTVVVPALAKRTITIPTGLALSGGTVAFAAGQAYKWSGAAWVLLSASKVGKSAFQNIFPPSTGGQPYAFNDLYTNALGAQVGSVVTASAPAIT